MKKFIIILSIFITVITEAKNFLIITKQDYLNTISIYTLWRSSVGDTVAVKTVETIESFTGNELSDKIRNFVIFTNSITKFDYLLLIGSYSDIPAKEVQPAYNISPQYSGVWNVKFYTDHYYADLTGEWDSNGNGVYGEYPDDNVTFSTDILVGRIPFESDFLIKDYLRRVILFNQDTREYKNRVILSAAILFFENENEISYPFIDSAKVHEYIKTRVLAPAGFNYYTFYEKSGIKTSFYSSDHTLESTTLLYFWQKGAGYVNIEAHGSPWGVYRKIWNADDGNKIPEEIEISYVPFIEVDSIKYLSNIKPSVVFANSCLTADPEFNNLCQAILKRGGINYIGGTTVIYDVSYWNDENSGGSSSFNYYFTKFLINDNLSVGKAFYKAKMIYTNFFNVYDEYLNEAPVVNQITLLSLNLFGDPSVSFNITNPGADNIPPYITDFTPEMDAIIDYSKVKINFRITDVFSGVDKSSIKLFIDDTPVYNFDILEIDPYSIEIEYINKNRLPNGRHSYKIIAADNVANTITNTVYFTINKKDTIHWIYQFDSYPNPCYNGDITFFFKADEDCNISLKIYNIAGELVQEYNNIPNYVWGNKIIWNRKNIYDIEISSGIYIAVLIAEKSGKTSAKSLILAIIN